MPSSLLVGLAVIAGLMASTLPSMRPSAMKEPFRFNLGSAHRSPSGEELWDATVTPDGAPTSLPPAFQLGFAPPGRAAPTGTAIQAVLRRADRRGMTFVILMLGETFGPSPQSSSGELTAIAVEPIDVIPLVLTANRHTGHGPWTALATLPNGGRFEIAIDSAGSRGEFRSVGEEDDRKVLVALVSLLAWRP